MTCLSRECPKLGLTVATAFVDVGPLSTAVESKMLAIPLDGACSHFHGNHKGRLLSRIRTTASCNMVLQPI